VPPLLELALVVVVLLELAPHWVWHTLSAPNESWEHGVLARQLVTQSELIVEQSMPNALHVKPPEHVASCAQA